MHPPGNEKGTLPGASLADLDLVSTDTAIVNQSGTKVKPVIGAGFENGSLVPSVEHSTRQPEKTPLTDEQFLLRVIGHSCSWSDGNPVRWQSFLVCAGFDTRPISDVAESLRVSPRLVQLRVAECRVWLAELRTELRGDTVPLKGKGDQP